MRRLVASLALVAFITGGPKVPNFASNIISSEQQVIEKFKFISPSAENVASSHFWDVEDTAYAKINLSLYIDPKSDVNAPLLGISTLMQKITWGDELYIKRISNYTWQQLSQSYNPTAHGDFLLLIDETPPGLGNAKDNMPLDDSNIIAKALDLVRTENERFLVVLRKRIPLGTGLGGGSADAALILKSFGSNVNGHRLGSDVPFLASNYDVALVSDYGNKIQALDNESVVCADDIYLFLPNETSSTAKVYSKAREMISSGQFKGQEMGEAVNEIMGMSGGSKKLKIRNDLEQCNESAKVQELLGILRRCYGNDNVGMTGSGCSVFLLGNDDIDGTEFKKIVDEYKDDIFIIKIKRKSVECAKPFFQVINQ